MIASTRVDVRKAVAVLRTDSVATRTSSREETCQLQAVQGLKCNSRTLHDANP